MQMKGKTSGFAAESGKSQTKDMLSTVSLEPPSTPISGDSRYLTRLWVSRHPEEVSQSEPSQSTITGVDGGKSSGFGSYMISNKISLEKPTPAFSGEERYLTPLWVSRKADELYDPSQDGFELSAGNIDQCRLIIHDKMETVLKMIVFREQQVLVQFWSPRIVGKHRFLTTIDQPFGLGVVNEGLYSYRRDSERKFYDVDKDHDAEDLSPSARVFRLGLPEWTSNVTNYLPKDFPQQECAIRCNLNGYLALPVFNLTTRSRVGVIELLTSSKHLSFAYEVQQFQTALKTQNLTCRQVSNASVSDVINEGTGRGNELENIFRILRIICDYYRLPLAQTWVVSSLTTISSHEQVLRMSCNSFDSRCLGKVCMSTCGLPYYVKDLGLWPFREACMEQHLDKFCGFVGRALLSGGSCFCEDVTKLSEDEYPLVHFARMHGLASSFAIHLHSVESNDDYVLEFFLPSHMKDINHVLNLVQLLKQYFDQVASRFELGDKSFIEVIGPPVDICVNIEPDIMDTFSDVPDIAKTDFVDIVPDECSSTSVSTSFTEGGETSSPLELGKKIKRGSKQIVYVKATYGEDSKGFWFRNSWGLSKLKNKVAKRFKLKSQMIRLKYLDEDNDLILFSSNDDLVFANVASGAKNRINLICESAT